MFIICVFSYAIFPYKRRYFLWPQFLLRKPRRKRRKLFFLTGTLPAQVTALFIPNACYKKGVSRGTYSKIFFLGSFVIEYFFWQSCSIVEGWSKALLKLNRFLIIYPRIAPTLESSRKGVTSSWSHQFGLGTLSRNFSSWFSVRPRDQGCFPSCQKRRKVSCTCR